MTTTTATTTATDEELDASDVLVKEIFQLFFKN